MHASSDIKCRCDNSERELHHRCPSLAAMTNRSCETDLHQMQKAGAMIHLCSIIPNHIWVIRINLSQEDQGGDFCSTPHISTNVHDAMHSYMHTWHQLVDYINAYTLFANFCHNERRQANIWVTEMCTHTTMTGVYTQLCCRVLPYTLCSVR